MGLSLRQVDLERLDRALTTILSPLAHQRCDDWRLAVESSVAVLLDGDHVVFGSPWLAFDVGDAFHVVRRYQILMHKHDHAQFCFWFEFHNGIR